MAQRVCLVSGGTGGHLMPALVLARTLQAAGHEPVLITEGRDVERELLARELPGALAFELPPHTSGRLGMPAWVLRATRVARDLLRSHAVQSVVSTGGRPSVPVGLAARSLGVPLYLLEQNAVTGRANRWLLPLARRIYHGLPSPTATGPRARVTGTPVRTGLGRIDRAAARHALGLPAAARVVLVTGGSQGARCLNEVVPDALAAMTLAIPPLHVLHLAGLGRDDDVRRRYATAGVNAIVRPVAVDMDRLFAAADLVICRGGGTTVAELCAVGRPAVIVPYPHHKDRQQLRNAEVLAHAGAALIVDEAALRPAALAELLAPLLASPERLAAMGHAAAALQPNDAAAAILGEILASYAATSTATLQPLTRQAEARS
jgi:UDP-N-acetylglucosamine--N-acetylmuramyl-(pentapeptide) pyrophosphoryl-undecaprenol N-acetylglucosamine transferase